MDRFQLGDPLGQGSYGAVFEAFDTEYNRKVAIKQIKLKRKVINSSILREALILKELDHPNLVKLYNVLVEGDMIYLVMERVACDLPSYRSLYEDRFESAIKRLLKDLISGIHHCHSRGIVHRDLKPKNLLVDGNDRLRVADFGTARLIGLDLPLTPQAGTLSYRAPEILLGAQYGLAADMWSIGVVFAEMMSDRRLFTGLTPNDMLKDIFRLRGTPSEDTWAGVTLSPRWDSVKDTVCVPQDISVIAPALCSDGLDLLSRLLTVNPEIRISAEDALGHPFFS